MLAFKSRTEKIHSSFLGFCLISHLLEIGTKNKEWQEVHMTSTSSVLHHEGWNSRLCTAHSAAVLGATLPLHKKCPSQQNCDSWKNWQIPMKTVIGSFHHGTCYCGLWHSPAKWVFLYKWSTWIFNILFLEYDFQCQHFFKKTSTKRYLCCRKSGFLMLKGFPVLQALSRVPAHASCAVITIS